MVKRLLSTGNSEKIMAHYKRIKGPFTQILTFIFSTHDLKNYTLLYLWLVFFKDVVGNKQLTEKLRHDVDTGRIPHARLFSGAEGDAKLSIALAYVQYLMCEDKRDGDSCGTCKACIKNTKLIHPDVHFSFPVFARKPGDKPTSNDFMTDWRKALNANAHLHLTDWLNIIGAENKQGNITADECRSIISKLSLKPFESDKRVLFMWLPEFLGPIGNTLLKILEEPPEKTYFILLTEKEDFIISTILSRVQMSRVKPYSESEIKELLVNQEVDEEMADSISFLAAGNMHMAQQLLNESDKALDATVHFQTWMRSCFQYKMSEMMHWSDETAKMGRENIKAFLTYGLGLIRESMATQLIPEYTIRYAQKEQEFIRNFSRAIQFANIETLYVEINKSIAEIERNANPRITLLNLSIQLATAFSAQKRQKV